MDKYKSQGEEVIAEILTKYHIDFVYEYPLLIKEQKENDTEKLRIWYPDFWLPKYSIIIEYFGMDDNPSYHKGKQAKWDAYKKLDMDCIPVYPKTIQGDLKSYLLINIKKLINEKVRHFENRNK
ncbi:MAG: hypothetical protein Q8P15_02665 [Nanoarchaeota archaeon]|nr:hypothetical protein [Nanoarchaeota archaeon]